MRMNRFISSRIILCITCLILFCAIPMSAFASENNGNNQTKTIRVGYFLVDGFQEYDQTTQVYSGYSYEFLMAIAAYTDWNYEFVPCATFAEALEMLKEGKVDLLNDVSKSAERNLEYSNLNSGTSCSYLLMHKGDNRVAYNDWDGIANIKIGLDKENIHSNELLALLENHKVTPGITWYENEPELIAAWNKGEVDAYAAISDTAVDGQAILRFSPEQYYLAAAKGNTELMSEVDLAIQSLRANDPSLESTLYEKYYGRSINNYTALTKEEQEYVLDNPVVRVLYVPDWYPISYQDENGDFAGPFRKIYSLLEERTGLQFAFVPMDYDAPFEGMVKTYNCYMLAEHPANYTGVAQYNAKLTQTFANAPLVEVTKGTLKKGDTIALVEGDNLSEIAQRLFGDDFEYTFTDSIDQCIAKVQNGEVDGTILMSYESEYYQSLRKYKNLIYTNVNDGSYGFALAVSNEADPLLYSIIVKGLNSISTAEVNNIFNQMTQELQKRDIWDTMIDNPLPFAAALVVFVVMFVMTLSSMHFNKKIKVKNEELVHANAAKSDFLSRMSHELRTPLNALQGYTELTKENIVAENPDTNYQLPNLTPVKEASRYLLRIIDDILDMQNIKYGKLTIKKVPVNAEKYIGIIYDEISKEAKEKGIQLSIERLTRFNETYMIDDIRCGQVIMNVLHNAVKFTPQGGSVHMTVEAKPLDNNWSEIKVVVSDTGIGMSQEFMDHNLFTEFAQEDQGLKASYDGCGTGMILCKELLELMEGTISCTSEKGKGSVFTITIKAEAVKEKKNRRASKTNCPSYDLSGTRILLCEDNPMNQDMEKRILEKMKCEVDIAEDGQIGLEKFIQSDVGDYDMILMDIRMPNMDGLEATREIRALERQDAKTVPILAVSANAFEEDIKASLDAGMNEHLAKPVSANILYEKITEYTQR